MASSIFLLLLTKDKEGPGTRSPSPRTSIAFLSFSFQLIYYTTIIDSLLQWVELSHKGVWKKNGSACVGFAMLTRPNETAIHGCLIPARLIWLCACVRSWPHHGAGAQVCQPCVWPFFHAILKHQLFTHQLQAAAGKLSYIWQRSLFSLHCNRTETESWSFRLFHE